MLATGIFAVDIETGGQLIGRNPIVAIGWCFGDMAGKVLFKGRVSLKEDEHDHVFEKRCVDEYWSKDAQAKQLKTFRKEAIEIAAGLAAFLRQLVVAEAMCKTLYIVSDNPAFDFAFLNYYLSYYLRQMPLSYRITDGVYAGQLGDEWYVLRKFTRKRYRVTPELVESVHKQVAALVTHDHWPENDAHSIYLTTIGLCRTLAC